MAGLKADLDSYLSGSKTSTTLSSLSKSFSLPTLKSPFGNKDSFKQWDFWPKSPIQFSELILNK